MPSSGHKTCSWKDCHDPATKHVRFGYRVLGSRDVPAPGENYTILHRSLCDTHVENIRDSYLDVTVYRIGNCPACDGTAAEAH